MKHKESIVEAALSSGLGRNARIFDDDDVIYLLRAAVENEGSQRAVAERYGLDRSDLSAILNRRKPISGPYAKSLGLRKVYVVESRARGMSEE